MSNKVPASTDVLIVGAGFSGLCMLHRMRKLGLNALVLEASDSIGGTWHHNRYPGARCDVESFEYSYSFDNDLQQEWRWSERYAKQAEILQYLNHVAERFDLNRDIRLQTRVDAASWQDKTGHWKVKTKAGEIESRFLIMATGCLSIPNIPEISGLRDFKGPLFHTANWPRDGLELKGKRVGVIGTGSSSVQAISNLAPATDELFVFQRTPHYVVPAGIRPIGDEEDRLVKENYPALREQLASSLLGMGVTAQEGSARAASAEEREIRYEAAWQHGGACFLMSFNDLLVDSESNKTACEFVGNKIRSIVKDQEVAEALIPDSSHYPIGARRLVMDDNYYSRFNEKHVHLVDTRNDAIASIREDGISLVSGRHIPLDIIVLGTGFDALTGALLNMDIQGKNNRTLKQKWAQGAKTYLGLTCSDFPNMFMITGPGSPSVFSNVVVSIEQHVDFISDIINWMRKQNYTIVENREDAEIEWSRHVNEVAQPTVLSKLKSSWYWGANVKDKPSVLLPYLGGVGPYRDECKRIRDEGFSGFSFRS